MNSASRWTIDDWKFNKGRLKDFYLSKKRIEEGLDLLPTRKECQKIISNYGVKIR